MLVRCKNCFQEYEEDFGLCPFCGYADGELPEKPFCLTPGTVIADRYIIGAELNSGGFGIVYKAWDRKLDTLIAIKEYYPSGLVNRQPGSTSVILVATRREKEFVYGKTRFLEEARNMAKFSGQKNIINVYDFFESNNTAYIVMEYLDGRNLRQILDEQSVPLPYDYCINVATQVGTALEAIHKENILHRDVSPDNIMVCSDGTVKLFDFGAARFSAGIENRVTVVVKPGYAPPEQYDKVNRQDPRTDIYALGATLYHAMTGVVPEESTNRKIDDKLREPSEIDHTIPENISNAIMRAMAVEPQFRFPSVSEFITALTSGRKVASVQKERTRRWRRRALGICASLAVIIGIAAAVALTLKTQKDVATLPDAELCMWYIQTGDDVLDGYKEAALENIVKDFTTEYTNINIELVPMSIDGYLSALTADETPGSMPAIFESSNLEVSNYAAMLPEDLGKESETYVIPIIDENRQKLVSGIAVPVVYVNSTKGSLDTIATMEDIRRQCAESSLVMAVNDDGAAIYERLYGPDVRQYIAGSAMENFLNRSVDIYLGTSKDYFRIQTALPGEYAAIIPDCEVMTWENATQWSISNLDGDTVRVAEAFLEYLTSPLAQDHFHIENQSGELPIDKNALDEYVEIYGELKEAVDFLSRTQVVGNFEESEQETEPALEETAQEKIQSVQCDIQTKDMSVSDGQGKIMADVSYDLVVLSEETGATKKINQALYEDYQLFCDDTKQLTPESLAQEEGLPYVNKSGVKVVHNADGIISFKYETEWYWGGGYNGSCSGKTFDLNTGEELHIPDLIDADDGLILTCLKEQTKRHMRFIDNDIYYEEAEQTVDGYGMDDFPYYVENGQVVLCFETYKLASGAVGPIEIGTTLYLNPLESIETVEHLAGGATYGGWSWLDKSPDGSVLYGDLHFGEDMSCVLYCGYFQAEFLAAATGTYHFDGENLTMDLVNGETGDQYHFEFDVASIGGTLILTQVSEKGPFYFYSKGKVIELEEGEMSFF